MVVPLNLMERYIDLINTRRSRINDRMSARLAERWSVDLRLPHGDLTFLCKQDHELANMQDEWLYVNRQEDRFWETVKVTQ